MVLKFCYLEFYSEILTKTSTNGSDVTLTLLCPGFYRAMNKKKKKKKMVEKNQ